MEGSVVSFGSSVDEDSEVGSLGSFSFFFVPAFFFPDISFILQLFQKGRNRIGFEAQRFAKELLIHLFFFPKHHHHDVLCISQVYSLKQWFIFPRDQIGYRIQRKAQLVFQP